MANAPPLPSPPSARPAIRPRSPKLAFDAPIPRHWFGGSALATQMSNGLNLLFPAGERFFVRSVRHFLDRIEDDPALREQVRGFAGQEGRHANAHERFFEVMEAQGYETKRFLAAFDRVAFAWVERAAPPELRLAATAAAEHYTAVMAENALAHDVFANAHPTMRRLLSWHAAEELEHKSVAFDVLQRVNPSYALRVAGLALSTAVMASFWLAATIMLLRQDGVSLSQVRREAAGIDPGVPKQDRVFSRGIREYLRRDFHPSQRDTDHLARDLFVREAMDT